LERVIRKPRTYLAALAALLEGARSCASLPLRANKLSASLIFLLVILQGSIARATAVVLVRTSDATPYTQADAAITQRLAQHQFTVRSLLAKDVSQQGIDAAIGKADVVVAIGTSAARWLHKELGPSTTLVYCMVSNAKDAGLLDGRSAFGVTTDVTISQQLGLIGEALPRARSVGMLYHSDSAAGKSALALMTAALPAGWHVEPVAVNDYGSIADAIDALTQKNVDIIWTTADQKLYDSASVRALLLSALRAKIPVWGFSPAFVRAGALLGVGVEPSAQGTQAADLVIELAADPKQLPAPAASPNEFQIAVNFIVAQQLGITIPDSLSARATYLYKAEK
jgi:ABC-type uncharacterized transport system substrate-binding protein